MYNIGANVKCIAAHLRNHVVIVPVCHGHGAMHENHHNHQLVIEQLTSQFATT